MKLNKNVDIFLNTIKYIFFLLFFVLFSNYQFWAILSLGVVIVAALIHHIRFEQLLTRRDKAKISLDIERAGWHLISIKSRRLNSGQLSGQNSFSYTYEVKFSDSYGVKYFANYIGDGNVLYMELSPYSVLHKKDYLTI